MTVRVTYAIVFVLLLIVVLGALLVRLGGFPHVGTGYQRSEAIDFPEVEGFRRSKPFEFPDPRHGSVVSYEAGPVRINIYVYDSGLDFIPDGASSNVVKEEAVLVEEGLRELRRRGKYRSYAERASGESRVGDSPDAPRAQRRLFEIEREDGGRILTDVYITGYRNHFVKIRLTYPEGMRTESERVAAPVLNALGACLRP